MNVTTDGNFTSGFRKEIIGLLPAAANFSYQDTVKLVGTANIDNVILRVASANGNLVSQDIQSIHTYQIPHRLSKTQSTCARMEPTPN